MIAAALHWWGAIEIRTYFGEVLFLTFAGTIWLIGATQIFPWLGLSVRDDIEERRNTSALVALCGALLGIAIIYAGGNLGEGPSYSNNFFSAALGTVTLLVLWLLLELGGNVSVSIAEERDVASGLRLGGLLLAVGLILGRAVAGNWHSATATIHDLIRDGWPAAALWAVALAIERMARPNRHCPSRQWPRYGLVPVIFYIAMAAAWLWRLGAWEGMPR
jgi:uncharacterized membrane protein YjfL (UPF0719 family)